MATLSFAGGDHTPAIKGAEELVSSARAWLNLAAQDYTDAAEALQRGDRPEAIARLRAAESKSYQARQDIAEAIAVEAGSR